MRYILALATVAMIGVAGAAFASEQARDRTPKRAISADRIKAEIDTLGYDVDRMKKDDDEYRVRLIDRDTGSTVKASFDAKTGELVRAKLARDEHEADEREEAREDREAGEHKGGAQKEKRDDRAEHRGERD